MRSVVERSRSADQATSEDSETRRPAPTPWLDDALASLTQMIDGITDSAERSAAETNEKARAESEELLERRRGEAEHAAAEIGAAAAETVARTREVVERVSATASALREHLLSAADQLQAAIADMDRSLAATERSTDLGVPNASAGAPDDRDPASSPLVRAAQLAIGGSSRDEIGEALRAEFGIVDPAPILDEALGRG